MGQQFNPKRVLRQVSRRLLKEFFEKQGHPIAVPWDSVSNTQVDDIFDAWQRLPDGPRKSIEIVLHDVDKMAQEDGTCVIIEEGQYHGLDLSSDMEHLESGHDKAVWTVLNHPAVWDAAIRFAEADGLSTGRFWVKRPDIPQANPRIDAEGLKDLEDAVSAFFRERQGRGHHCRAEHFARGGRQDYFFVYLSDYADMYINFDDAGAFQKTAERRAFEVVFAYDRANATLEMFAKGGRKVIGPLQQMFCRVILGEEMPPEDREHQPFALDGLIDRGFRFPTDPEDGIVEVSVRSVRLALLGRLRGRITLDADPAKGPAHIHKMLDDYLNQKQLPRSILHVTRATISLRLNGNGHGRSLTFSVAQPNSCDLKSKRDDHRLLGEKYLRKWGIDVAKSA